MRPTTSPAGWRRRQMFRAAKALGPSGKDLYASLGVRPIINAHGTFAIIGNPDLHVRLPDLTGVAKTEVNILAVRKVADILQHDQSCPRS